MAKQAAKPMAKAKAKLKAKAKTTAKTKAKTKVKASKATSKKAAPKAAKKSSAKSAAKKPAPIGKANSKKAVAKSAQKTSPKNVAKKKSNTKMKIASGAAAAGAIIAAASAYAIGKTPNPLKPKAKASKSEDLSALISPLEDRLLVEVAEQATRTAGGLFIPDSVDSQDRQKQGKVVAVGRGRVDRKGRLHPLDVQLGDTVIFEHYLGSPVQVGDRELLVLRESQLLGVVKA